MTFPICPKGDLTFGQSYRCKNCDYTSEDHTQESTIPCPPFDADQIVQDFLVANPAFALQSGCVNPDHLFLGTHAENMTDCKNKGRAACNEGNKNPNAKLTESDVIKIRSSKMSAKILAEKYGVSTTLIYYIKKRLAWCHVPEQADNASELMVLD